MNALAAVTVVRLSAGRRSRYSASVVARGLARDGVFVLAFDVFGFDVFALDVFRFELGLARRVRFARLMAGST